MYQDRYHELYTTQAGTGIPLDAFVEFLKPLEIADSPEGIRVTPRRGSGAKIKLHIGSAVIDEVTALTAYFTPEALAAVPAHRGAPVGGGELWKVDQNLSVLLANDSVALVLEPMSHADAPAFAAVAQSLRVTRSLGSVIL